MYTCKVRVMTDLSTNQFQCMKFVTKFWEFKRELEGVIYMKYVHKDAKNE
jgi:hypothetical protein